MPADGRLVNVPPAKLRPHPLNDNKQSEFMFGKLLATIRSEGFAQPIVARSGSEAGPFADGMLEIVGGEHRWRAAQHLKLASIPVYDLGNVTDQRARKLLVNLNKLHGEADQDALSRLVREIAAVGDTELESLPFDEDTLRDMLDCDAEAVLGDAGPGDGIAGESDGAVADLGAGVTARDILVILGVKGLNKTELSALIETVRQWAYGREDQDVPAWRDLVPLLKSKTRRIG
jgi:hypothetical protein